LDGGLDGGPVGGTTEGSTVVFMAFVVLVVSVVMVVGSVVVGPVVDDLVNVKGSGILMGECSAWGWLPELLLLVGPWAVKELPCTVDFEFTAGLDV